MRWAGIFHGADRYAMEDLWLQLLATATDTSGRGTWCPLGEGALEAQRRMFLGGADMLHVTLKVLRATS